VFLNPANLLFVTICHRVNYMYNGKQYFTLKGNNLPGMFMLHPLIHFNLSSELDSLDCNAIVQITQYLIKSTKSWAMGFIVISTSCLKLLLTPIVALKMIKTFKFHCQLTRWHYQGKDGSCRTSDQSPLFILFFPYQILSAPPKISVYLSCSAVHLPYYCNINFVLFVK